MAALLTMVGAMEMPKQHVTLMASTLVCARVKLGTPGRQHLLMLNHLEAAQVHFVLWHCSLHLCLEHLQSLTLTDDKLTQPHSITLVH